ncbi:TlpA disulfide reductase family protein [Serinicoccus sp. LYQ131]|uniref:TlpA disulfide reductase family protein n=1 Tax=Serinicoccus sp. LYQ131 TaxID=3378797 RepID=UPI003853CFB0
MSVGTQVVNDRNVVQMLAPDERTSELAIDGITLSGSPWSSMDYTDTVLVINVWGSWCPPCVAEMPELVEVANEFADEGKPVQFLGINTRDSTATAQAFERRFDVRLTPLGGHPDRPGETGRRGCPYGCQEEEVHPGLPS